MLIQEACSSRLTTRLDGVEHKLYMERVSPL
jgi:hypothetical protein